MKSILIIACILLSMQVLSQNSFQLTETTKKESQEQLPGLKDWFLSTGNWQNDPQLYVREFGNGADTIIMLHGGWGGEHSGLIDAVGELKSQYHFIFYDQRGSLRSPFPDSLITFNHHIEDLELLRRELALDKLRIVAHSMGAVLASAYALKYPHRIKHLTLLAPASLKNPIPKEDMELLKQQQVAFQEFLDRHEVAQELDKYTLNRDAPILSSIEETSRFRIRFAARMLYDISKWPYLMGGRAIYKGHVFQLTAQTYPESGWDYLQEFNKREYPVSIVIGDHDFLDFGNHLIKKWVNGIPQVKLTTIKNAGHILWLDQPEIFTKELLRSLNH